MGSVIVSEDHGIVKILEMIAVGEDIQGAVVLEKDGFSNLQQMPLGHPKSDMEVDALIRNRVFSVPFYTRVRTIEYRILNPIQVTLKRITQIPSSDPPPWSAG